MTSLVDSSKHLRKKLLSVFYNLFQKIEAERTLYNTFYEVTLPYYQDKVITGKENSDRYFLPT